MIVNVGSEITIDDCSPELLDYLNNITVFPNPEYEKKKRLGFWIGDTSKTLTLARIDKHDGIISVTVPYGYINHIVLFTTDNDVINYQFNLKPRDVAFSPKGLILRDYQDNARKALILAQYGILEAPAGSGKTHIGLAVAFSFKKKTLWVTHTHDLLIQSKRRAEQFINKSLIGVIENGKVQIGEGITFAVVNTLTNLDLSKYKDVWEVVIVDEVHRVSGSETQVTMFSHVLNSLSAPHKYGLSATLHRADGLIKTAFAMVGDIVHSIPDEAVNQYVMDVNILLRSTNIGFGGSNTDGTIDYAQLISDVTLCSERNNLIVNDIIRNKNQYCLILSSRIEHLELLQGLLPKELRNQSVMVTGKMTSKKDKALRESYLEEVRQGNKHFLFATYRLAKEGLDIPRLNRLFMATPEKDEAVIIQSIGRIARIFPDKLQPICYDYIDAGRLFRNQFAKRKSSYRKKNCKFINLSEETT